MKKMITAAAVFLATATASSAANITLDFSGVSSGTNVSLGGDFVADEIRITNGNCLVAPCAALNGPVDLTTISRVGNKPFTVDSFWYEFVGNRNILTVSVADMAGTFTTFANFLETVVGSNNGGQFAGGPANIYAIRFDSTSGTPGNIRIDDLSITTTPIPLPAAGGMLLLGLGAMAVGRRKKRPDAKNDMSNERAGSPALFPFFGLWRVRAQKP